MTVWPQCPRPEPWNWEGDRGGRLSELGPAFFMWGRAGFPEQGVYYVVAKSWMLWLCGPFQFYYPFGILKDYTCVIYICSIYTHTHFIYIYYIYINIFCNTEERKIFPVGCYWIGDISERICGSANDTQPAHGEALHNSFEGNIVKLRMGSFRKLTNFIMKLFLWFCQSVNCILPGPSRFLIFSITSLFILIWCQNPLSVFPIVIFSLVMHQPSAKWSTCP